MALRHVSQIQELEGQAVGELDRDALKRLKSRTDEGKKAKDTIHSALVDMLKTHTGPSVQPQTTAGSPGM